MPLINEKDVVLVIIDVQEKLMNVVLNASKVIRNIIKLCSCIFEKVEIEQLLDLILQLKVP